VTASKTERSHSDARITVTANRAGDTFSYSGFVTSISGNSIAATLLSNLTVDELVRLRYKTNSLITVETHARVSSVQDDKCHFELVCNDAEGQRCIEAPYKSGTTVLADDHTPLDFHS
jgi:hypothetical protein